MKLIHPPKFQMHHAVLNQDDKYIFDMEGSMVIATDPYLLPVEKNPNGDDYSLWELTTFQPSFNDLLFYGPIYSVSHTTYPILSSKKKYETYSPY